MNYNVTTLNNGLRIIHLPSNSQVVYCGYAIDAGSRDEQQGEEGLAHFCEHMTFKGTERLSPMRIINSLECVGGDLNAFTTKEDTFYYATVQREHFKRAVTLLTDIVFHSTYPQHEIDKEVEVVCDEIDSYRDSPAELIYDEFENCVFRNHPLGHNVLGNSEQVRRFTTADCRRFTSRHYTPRNAVFYVLGDIDFPRLVKYLDSILPSVSKETPAINEETHTLCQPEKVTGSQTMQQDTHQAHVMIGTVIPKDKSRVTTLFLLNNILGGPAMSSRLNISLRERRGLVYNVESVMLNYSDNLLWSVYFGCDPKDVRRCTRLVNSELRRIISKPLSANALNAAKRQLKGQLALAADNHENFAIDMAKQYLHRGTLKDNAELCRHIDAVTSADIHTLANQYLTEDNLFTLIFN